MKIRKEERHSPNTTLKSNRPVSRILDFSDNVNSMVTKEVIKESYELGGGEMRTIELPVLKDTEIKT